ncbi:MAG: 50S ribosomal protein L25/general stress protein Ctc [Blastocatellia bacterium]|nr:50S ribosomal protein L25/general stress protein Ctc [Blastocatellia bacterium]MCS7156716.1 50S ribosomal protein L25/general stress protein Ctc [Blastocatellia bacterium]MCX7751542.1 50S ribosomal protein L25/general stress protein Ctc [Blastocatellia bacterium]MDW8168642.1 50S ribosomal protein L25/general stress protein Ctc [Acidobacteriota bacterium]MDW8256537.1 50S ribosomal protein L25/general stress protein Ctc [Acidobacteriota bacterium]
MSLLDVTVSANIRTRLGKGGARQLRRAGKIPAILYGGAEPPVPIAVEKARVLEIFRKYGHTSIFTLAVDGNTVPVIIKDWQLDPITGVLLHVDFLRVDLGKPTRVKVPVELVGEAVGVRQGGLLDFATHELEIECLPTEIPARLQVDVSALEIGDHIAVKDLQLGDRVRVLDDPERVIVSVLAPRVIAEEAAPTMPVEPEVIKKGKAEEEEEA